MQVRIIRNDETIATSEDSDIALGEGVTLTIVPPVVTLILDGHVDGLTVNDEPAVNDMEIPPDAIIKVGDEELRVEIETDEPNPTLLPDEDEAPPPVAATPVEAEFVEDDEPVDGDAGEQPEEPPVEPAVDPNPNPDEIAAAPADGEEPPQMNDTDDTATGEEIEDEFEEVDGDVEPGDAGAPVEVEPEGERDVIPEGAFDDTGAAQAANDDEDEFEEVDGDVEPGDAGAPVEVEPEIEPEAQRPPPFGGREEQPIEVEPEVQRPDAEAQAAAAAEAEARAERDAAAAAEAQRIRAEEAREQADAAAEAERLRQQEAAAQREREAAAAAEVEVEPIVIDPDDGGDAQAPGGQPAVLPPVVEDPQIDRPDVDQAPPQRGGQGGGGGGGQGPAARPQPAPAAAPTRSGNGKLWAALIAAVVLFALLGGAALLTVLNAIDNIDVAGGLPETAAVPTVADAIYVGTDGNADGAKVEDQDGDGDMEGIVTVFYDTGDQYTYRVADADIDPSSGLLLDKSGNVVSVRACKVSSSQRWVDPNGSCGITRRNYGKLN